MKRIAPRPLTPDEVSVLQAALALVAAEASLRFDHLAVQGLCECGCRTVYFDTTEQGDRRVFDGCGTTSNGRMVEVLVWAKNERITALDIVDYESTGLLPTADSVRPWEDASRERPNKSLERSRDR